MPQLQRWFTRRRLMVVGLAIASMLIVSCCRWFPLLASQPWVQAGLNRTTWIQWFNGHPTGGVIMFVIAHGLAAVVGIPGALLVVIGGVVFGVVWGTIWSVLGATLGAIAAFCIARYYLRCWVEQRFGHHPTLQMLNRLLRSHDLSCVLAIRFAPISPFSVVNFLFGLTCVPFKTYVMGTAIGIIPGTLAYTWLGAAGHDAWHGDGVVSLGLALGLLSVLSLVPLVLRRCQCD